jgi:hypothetical protein
MRKEQAVALGRGGAVLVAGALGCGIIALGGGITVLAYMVASFASPDQGVAVSGAPAAISAVLAIAGVPAGITAMVAGVNAAQWIRARRRTGYPEATAGWMSGAVGLVMYVAAAGYAVLGSLYYYG